MMPPAAWPTGPLATVRRYIGRVRAWMCTRICDGYDRRAGRIVDSAIAARDAAIDDAHTARAELARMTGGVRDDDRY
jgi:hypothetical protein